jgi:hypothetical protein
MAGEKRKVPLLQCNKLIDSQNLQMVPTEQLYKRSIVDNDDVLMSARSTFGTDAMERDTYAPGLLLGTRDLQKKVKDVQGQGEIHAAAPFLGYSEEHSKGGERVFGGTNISSAPLFQF